ncbi:50S ribosomal protein L18 [Candidatus Woesearchaeota archaeon]|nr:50S ribosomal protein L18 [Candidatus Woesearchaeota archaeon]
MKKKKETIQFKRKREKKTNYKKRLKILLAQKPRLVIRPSLKNMTAQLIEYHPKGDITIISADSKELEKLGWKFNKGNVPSAYLTGLLIGKKAKEKSIKEAILDTGLCSLTKGSRIYACLKGAVDAGLDIPCSEDIFPEESRIKGEHISSYRKIEDFSKEFDSIKNKILKVK